MDTLFDGIDLGRGVDLDDDQRPGADRLAMYVAVAERPAARARAAVRHDPERHPEGVPGPEGVHLPAAALAAAGHRHDRASRPPRCRACTRSRSPATTSAKRARRPARSWPSRWPTASPTSRRPSRGRPRRRRRSRPGSRFFFNCPPRLLRGDRQVPGRPAHLGPLDAGPLRRHATSARCASASTPRPPASRSPPQQPEINIARVAIQALAAVLGGTQSLHTDSYDEALALPVERAARIALRTQQIIAHETGVAPRADPLGGSAYVEWMTDEMERQAEEIFAHLLELGDGSMLEGVLGGHRQRLVRRARSPTPPTGTSGRQHRRADRGRGQPRTPRATSTAADAPAHRAPTSRPPRSSAWRPPARDRDQAARRRRAGSRRGRTPPTRRRNLMPPFIDAVRAQGHRGRDRARPGGGLRHLHRARRGGLMRPDAVRIVLAKLGLDGHDRGLKVVARMLRDAGIEVVYLGLRQTPETVVAAAQQEDADLDRHQHAQRRPPHAGAADGRGRARAGVEAPVVVGGIIPDEDVAAPRRGRRRGRARRPARRTPRSSQRCAAPPASRPR